MTTSKRTFGLMSSSGALSAEILAERTSASTRVGAPATTRKPLPIASEWLSENELSAVRKAVGPVRLQITDSILSKLG